MAAQTTFMNIRKILSIGSLFILIGLLPYLFMRLHHTVVFGLNPMVGPDLLIIVALLLLPFVMKMFRWFRKNWFTNPNQEPVILFILGSLSWLISTGFTSESTFDIHLHDTMFVFSLGMIMFFGMAFFGYCATTYFLISNAIGRDLNIRLSRLHFWISFFAMLFLFWMNYQTREMIGPQHYTAFSGWSGYQLAVWVDRYILAAVTLLLTAQVLFIINIVYSLFRSRRSNR